MKTNGCSSQSSINVEKETTLHKTSSSEYLPFFFPCICVLPCCSMALGTTTMSIQFMCCFSFLVCACNYIALQVRNQNILHVSNLNLVLNVLKNSCFSVQRIRKSPSGEGKLLNGCSKWFSVPSYFECNTGNCFLPNVKWVSDFWSK